MEVIYERDPDIGNGFQAYRGRLQGTNGVCPFVGFPFDSILRLINENIPVEDMQLTFIRSDRPELAPYALKDELIFLIKTNVEDAIQQMSVPPIRIVVGRPPATPAVLSSCADTLAGAFGDKVLIGRRKDKAECPGCGSWVHVGALSVAAPKSDVPSVVWLLTCACGCSLCTYETPDSLWFEIQVEDLLATRASRFFLPRAWNGYKPWITHVDLRLKLEEFKKEKEKFDASR